MLASRAAASSSALKQLIEAFRAEGLPLLGVKGHAVPLQGFNVEQQILQHAAATNSALSNTALSCADTHVLRPLYLFYRGAGRAVISALQVAFSVIHMSCGCCCVHVGCGVKGGRW